MSEGAPTPQNQEPRSRRKIRRGVVVSNKMQKTVVVLLSRSVQHPLYGKTVKKSSRLKAHDDLQCDVGDVVEVMETRPISKEKNWRVTQIIEKVK
jgi:small subunit ribosomal protein S17